LYGLIMPPFEADLVRRTACWSIEFRRFAAAPFVTAVPSLRVWKF
jgi:hypothetical protein